jgi:hypothetical protein
MDDQRDDRESGGSVDKPRRFVRVLFWAAVGASILSVAAYAREANVRGVVVNGVMCVIALLMALSIEFRWFKK